MLTTALLALALATASTPADSQSARFPDTPAGRAAAAWLAAFNAGDLGALRRFVGERYAPSALGPMPAEAVAGREWWRRYNLGALELVRVEEASDTLVRALVRQPQVAGWGRIELRLTGDSLPRVAAVGLSRYDTPPAEYAETRPLTEREAVAELDRFARGLAERGHFAGTLVLSRHGRPLLERAYGLADRATRTPNAAATQYDLASVGKLFAAVAVAQLVERGKLSYDDPIGALLPDYPNAEAARRVRVRHLLTHTSGLADYFRNPKFDLTADTLTRQADYLPYFAADSLRFEPGTRWDYANSNFALLGAIVERVSGETYVGYLRRHVFAPAGMTATWPERATRQATGYTWFGERHMLDVDGGERTAPRARPVGAAAGGGVATARDMVRFLDALLARRLVGGAAADSLFAGHEVEIAPGARTGFGFDHEDRTGAARYVTKSGYSFGAHTRVSAYPETGWSVVVLGNVDTWGSEAVAYRADALLQRVGTAPR